MIQIFSLALAANESREVAVSGEYFELRNAIEPIALVELLDRSGSVISRLENPEQSDYVKPGRYETIRITNGPNAQVVRHFYGSGDAGSRRTSGLVQVDGTVNVMGDVSVIDGEKSRTLAGGMFAAGATASAVVVVYSVAQLWNPPASGKNLIVSGVSCHSTVQWSVVAYHSSAALGSDVTATDAANKKGGAAMGVGLVKVGNIAFPAFASTKLRVMSGAAFIEGPWNIRGALVVPPGGGLSLVMQYSNAVLNANFEWFEEPV